MSSLREFFPDQRSEDWVWTWAGQRVCVMKQDPKKIGVLQLGTEVIVHQDGSICGLLGQSPGASISGQVQVDVICKCFPEKLEKGNWKLKLRHMIPSFGVELNSNRALCAKIKSQTAKILQIDQQD